MRWTPPSPPIEDLRIRFPSRCRSLGRTVFATGSALPGVPETLHCEGARLAGTIAFESSQPSGGRVAVNVEWLTGQQTFLLSSGSPATVTVPDAATGQGPFDVLRRYLALGVEHIWFGIDHLLFLLGLLLLVGGFWSVLYTVSAFTVAHSLTLAVSALGLVTVPTGPVEICIALSVLLLALETRRGPLALTRRFPHLVALGFGLLHGLGFASALSEVGLPSGARSLALLGFNLGVELGQVLVVAIAAVGHSFTRRHAALRDWLLTAFTWVLGTASVYWFLERVNAWLAELSALA
jgi:hypothetical protein